MSKILLITNEKVFNLYILENVKRDIDRVRDKMQLSG